MYKKILFLFFLVNAIGHRNFVKCGHEDTSGEQWDTHEQNKNQSLRKGEGGRVATKEIFIEPVKVQNTANINERNGVVSTTENVKLREDTISFIHPINYTNSTGQILVQTKKTVTFSEKELTQDHSVNSSCCCVKLKTCSNATTHKNAAVNENRKYFNGLDFSEVTSIPKNQNVTHPDTNEKKVDSINQLFYPINNKPKHLNYDNLSRPTTSTTSSEYSPTANHSGILNEDDSTNTSIGDLNDGIRETESLHIRPATNLKNSFQSTATVNLGLFKVSKEIVTVPSSRKPSFATYISAQSYTNRSHRVVKNLGASGTIITIFSSVILATVAFTTGYLLWKNVRIYNTKYRSLRDLDSEDDLTIFNRETFYNDNSQILS